MRKLIKTLCFALPLAIGFASCSDDEADTNGVAGPFSIWECEELGVDSIYPKITVPATGGEYKFRCLKYSIYMMNTFEIRISTEDSTYDGSIPYSYNTSMPHQLIKTQQGDIATVQPALINEQGDTTILKWITIEENNNEKKINVKITGNEDKTRYAYVVVRSGLRPTYFQFKQAAK